jgi:DNA-binding GntR family transcriptional regulator
MSHNGWVPRFVVEPDSPLTAWGQVQRDLRRRIERRDFDPGSRIPSEAELVNYYGVSRMTVRRAIEALAADGLLRSRRGSGTFVTESNDLLRSDVDLLRPWREQLLATGHVAQSRLVETAEHVRIPDALRRDVEYDSPDDVRFGRHIQEADGVAIGFTESWMPEAPSAASAAPPTALVSAASSVRISFATAEQAALLDAYRDVPLLEVTTASRLRETGELVELAVTSWLASRVRFTFGRSLTLGNIDMAELTALISTPPATAPSQATTREPGPESGRGSR